MTSSKRRPCLVALLGVVLLMGTLSRPVSADPRKERASALLREGNARHDHGDYAGALELYREAQRLYPSYRIELNASQSLEALGQHVAAAESIERFLQQARADVDQQMIASAKQRLTKLRERLGSFEIHCALVGARVMVNSKLAGLTPLARRVYVEPGQTRVVVEADSYRPFTRTLWLDASQHLVLTVSLMAAPVTAPRRRFWTWVTAGGAGALLATGAGLGIAFLVNQHEHNTTHDDARAAALYQPTLRKAWAADAMYVAGAGLAVTAVVLYFFEGRAAPANDDQPRATRLWLAPGSAQLGLAASGRF